MYKIKIIDYTFKNKHSCKKIYYIAIVAAKCKKNVQATKIKNIYEHMCKEN